MLSNRWWIVLGALIIQLCLGAIYSWSVFVNPLKESFGFTTTQTQIIFSAALATFALVMIFAGRWQDKIGPRIVALLGGIALGAGYLLVRLAGISFTTMIWGVGIIGGAGLGLGYVCPIAALIKWFPDKRGLITGLAVAGFGAGAWIFAKLASNLIAAHGLQATMGYLGAIFLIAVSAGALILRNPPPGWRPAGTSAASQASSTTPQHDDFAWSQMVATPQFWVLWICYIFSAAAGLMVIGILKPFGISGGLSAAAAGSAVGILAVFNGAGRIVWGFVSDRLGRTRAMMVMFVLQGAMMLVLFRMSASTLLLGVASAWIGFNFGGNFALFPSATADYYGTKNVGVNYGLLFTAYGVAGIFGPVLGGRLYDLTGHYVYAFIIAGVACLVAALLGLLLKKPELPRVETA